jgi:hypothetical protein
VCAGDIFEGGLHPCSLESTESRGKKKRARKGNWSPGTSGTTTSHAELAETWLREVDGRLPQLVVKKLDATWSRPWEYKEETGNWEETTASLWPRTWVQVGLHWRKMARGCFGFSEFSSSLHRERGLDGFLDLSPIILLHVLENLSGL